MTIIRYVSSHSVAILCCWVFTAAMLLSFLPTSPASDANRLGVVAELVTGYFKPFSGLRPMQRADFETAVNLASIERNSRGATAIIQVIDREIYVDMTAFTSPYSWDRLRLQFILSLLRKSLGDTYSDFEMIVNVHDCPMRGLASLPKNVPIFSITKCKGSDSVIPLPQWNQNRDGPWSRWDQSTVRKSKSKRKNGKRKERKAVFRGAFRQSVLQYHQGSLKFVNTTMNNWRAFGRTKLLHLQSVYPILYNIGVTTSSSEEWRLITAQVGRTNNGTRLSMAEQVDGFTHVIHVEGACGWADRLKTFLSLGAVLLKQETVCKEFFEPLMRPWVHYIPIDNQLNNLTDILLYHADSMEGGADIEFIEGNAKTFSNEYLRREVWEYYFEEVVRRYSELWGASNDRRTISRRPGSRKFTREVGCGKQPKMKCDDSKAFA